MHYTVYQQVLLALFGVIAVAMVIDKNVADFFLLCLKFVGVQFQRWWWMVRFHPQNPLTNFIMERKMAKLARDLQKEYADQ